MTSTSTLKRSILLAAIAFGAVSCGNNNQSQLSEAWDRRNDPALFSPEYNRVLATLPLTGQADSTPWTDTYWPNSKGGLADRWFDATTNDDSFTYALHTADQLRAMSTEDLKKLSPAEKYDIFTGNYNYPFVQYERQRNKPTDEGWFGLCHGWAPAAINFQEPKPVTLTTADGIQLPFGSSDIKALLTFAQQYQRAPSATKFLGGRCNRKLDEDDNGGNAPECRDVNAGSFHIILANMVGIRKQGFVADVTRDYQVWNQPIFGFESEIQSESNDVYSSAAPGTVKIVTVKTTMHYVVEVSAQWEALADSDWANWFKTEREYVYSLELDANGSILGGEWVEGERPDFMWTQTTPPLNGYWTQLKTIYEASIQPTPVPEPAPAPTPEPMP
jgi:hypothetical protein